MYKNRRSEERKLDGKKKEREKKKEEKKKEKKLGSFIGRILRKPGEMELDKDV